MGTKLVESKKFVHLIIFKNFDNFRDNVSHFSDTTVRRSVTLIYLVSKAIPDRQVGLWICCPDPCRAFWAQYLTDATIECI